MALLAVGLPGLQGGTLAWLTAAMLALAALKLLEARSVGERRLVALLQLIVAGLLAAQRPELGPTLLQGAATIAALAGLLALELDTGLNARALLGRSLQVALAALPMALLLLVLAPRLEPIWPLPAPEERVAETGLSDDLDPGGIARLAGNDAPAARLAFAAGGPPPAAQRYWRVLVHERFDGRRWQRGGRPLAGGLEEDTIPLPTAGGPANQLWLMEPSRFTAVPWDGASRAPAGGDGSLRLHRSGELLLRQEAAQRRTYRLAGPARAGLWQRLQPAPVDLALPAGRQPRLEALGRRWAALPTTEARLAAAESWFRGQPFRYTLTPGALPETAGLDAFLFERREGFCGHYASAYTALMRAAGVPARVVSGYLGGTWVEPLGGSPFLDVRQSNAHAWSEVWVPGEGWRRVDPTTWAGGGGGAVAAAGAEAAAARAGWWTWTQRQWWGLDVAWSRWWLGFDRAEQETLLQRLLGERREWLGLLLLLAMGLALAGGLALLAALQRQGGDPTRRRLEWALRPLRRGGLEPEPGESLEQFCRRAGTIRPELAAGLAELAASYQSLRFAPPGPGGRNSPARLRRAARRLRRTLQQSRFSQAGAGSGTRGQGQQPDDDPP
jgi:transglutaminase-like putative cysteine protease